MSTIYVEWSYHRGVTALFGDTDRHKVYPNLATMLDDLKSPTRIVLETTFESYDRGSVDAARETFIRRCAAEGHEIRTWPNRLTGRWRIRMGFDPDPRPKGYTKVQSYATDLEDAKCFRAGVKAGVHLSIPHETDNRKEQLRIDANTRLMELRRSGSMVKVNSRDGSDKWKRTSGKDEYAKKLLPGLPVYDGLTYAQKLSFGNGKEYSLVVIAAVAVIAEHANNRDDFDFLSGLYAHAYPSQIRADLMHHQWAGGNKRIRLNPVTRKRDDLTLTDYRRELRWLYRQLKQLV